MFTKFTRHYEVTLNGIVLNQKETYRKLITAPALHFAASLVKYYIQHLGERALHSAYNVDIKKENLVKVLEKDLRRLGQSSGEAQYLIEQFRDIATAGKTADSDIV